jgi:hypothetical protein
MSGSAASHYLPLGPNDIFVNSRTFIPPWTSRF